MTIYNNSGYDLKNEFIHYGQDKTREISPLWEQTKRILGYRFEEIVYSNPGRNYYGSYIVDALMGAKGTLGIEIACVLRTIIPENDSDKVSIVCKDVINPYQIPANLTKDEDNWKLAKTETKTNLLEDERFLVAIKGGDGTEVQMYIFKKQ